VSGDKAVPLRFYVVLILKICIQEPPVDLIKRYQSSISQYTIPPVILFEIEGAKCWYTNGVKLQALVDYIQETTWVTSTGRSTRLRFYPMNKTAIVGPESDVVLFRDD